MLILEQTTLGHYRLLRRLCRGGMSEVYLAHDEEGDRDVAIKVANSYYGDLVERLQREAQAMRMLTQEQGVERAERISILPILDYGEEGWWHYLVMPYMKHGTLRERLARGRLSLGEAGMILEQIASALQFAHEHGILHRDIKPSNILLGDGQRVYLADFGLAKAIDQQEKYITQTGCLIGTPEYMAPELVEEPFSTSCDIYALGVLLYQMVTGQVPFKGSTPLSVYWKHIQEQPVLPSLVNPDIPGLVDEVILCAMDKDPRRRFQAAQELAEAYMQAIHGASTEPIRVRVLPLAQRGQIDKSVVGTRADKSAVGAINRPLRRAVSYFGKNMRADMGAGYFGKGTRADKSAVGTINRPLRVAGSFGKGMRADMGAGYFGKGTRVRVAVVVFLLVFLVVSSLLLGFFISQSGGQVRASQLLGASVQLQLADKTQPENATPTLGVPPTRSVFEDANGSQALPRHVQVGPKKTRQAHGHKHKHKHKSKPNKGDTRSAS